MGLMSALVYNYKVFLNQRKDYKNGSDDFPGIMELNILYFFFSISPPISILLTKTTDDFF